MSEEKLVVSLDKNLITHCRKRGLTLAALARLSGVKQPTLHGWSTGRSVKKMQDLARVCEVLEVSLYEILFGSNDPRDIKQELIEELFTGEIQITIKRIKRQEEL